MLFPLSKDERALFEEVKKCFGQQDQGLFFEQDYQKWQDYLNLMVERGQLWMGKTREGMNYKLTGDFSIFENWLLCEDKKAKKLSVREWKIAIISGVIVAFATPLFQAFFLWIADLF